MRGLAAVLLLILLAGVPARATELSRHALVIGNSSYPLGTLANARNDAALMADTLESLGFAVTRAFDVGRSRFFEEVAAFAGKLPRDAMAVVFYAGHGMQVQGANYLIPSDMVPTSEQGVAIRAYPVKSLIEKLAASAGAVNIVILDACRNNPFLPQRESRYRAFEGLGLSRVPTPRGMLVAYSTSPGQLAEDGHGRTHSHYTEALARVMVRPGKTIERIFKEVAEIVRRKTLDDQQPWFETSLVDDHYFVPQGGLQTVARIQKRMRSFDPSAVLRRSEDAPWFMKLGESDWIAIGSEIEGRARAVDAQSLPLLVHRAGTGNLVAQTTLGLAHLGEDAPAAAAPFQRDPALGLHWLRQAAEQGFPMAQAVLGEMYLEGRGIEQSPEAAERWLTRAAPADYAQARAGLTRLGRPLPGAPAPAR